MIVKNEDNKLKNDFPIPEVSYADLYNMGFWDHKVAKLTIVCREDISKIMDVICF